MSSIYSIYKATNTINGKIYIGFDSNWPARKKDHYKNYKNLDYKFYRAIRKYGWNNFEWEVIYQSKDKTHTLKVMEPHFIKETCSYKIGYNMTLGGDGVSGRKATPEEKEKNSQRNTGHLNPNYGKKRSKETRLKQSIAAKNRIYSDEYRKKISQQRMGEHNPRYGKKHSPETIEKMRLSALNRKKHIMPPDQV